MSEKRVLQQRAKGERPAYFKDEAIDKVLSITMALAGEVAVLHDRLDSLERVLEQTAGPKRASIEEFRPDAGVRAEREAWRQNFLDVVLRTIHQECEALQSDQKGDYIHAIDLVEKS